MPPPCRAPSHQTQPRGGSKARWVHSAPRGKPQSHAEPRGADEPGRPWGAVPPPQEVTRPAPGRGFHLLTFSINSGPIRPCQLFSGYYGRAQTLILFSMPPPSPLPLLLTPSQGCRAAPRCLPGGRGVGTSFTELSSLIISLSAPSKDSKGMYLCLRIYVFIFPIPVLFHEWLLRPLKC